MARVWTIAAIAWAATFSAMHWYWALGGRFGLGSSTAAADVAFGTPWFAAYNIGVAVATTGLAAWLWTTRPGRPERSTARRRVLEWALLMGAVLLAVRGMLGVCLLLVDLASGKGDFSSPLLVAVEPYFVLGGILLAFAWLTRRRRGVASGAG